MNTPREFLEIVRAIRGAADAGQAFVLVTLLQTRGSTYRRAGARMLVLEDGRVVRGLSGGCPEADIIARARDSLADGRIRVLNYNRENGLDVLMEQGCGGELEVLVEPLAANVDLSLFESVAAAIKTGRGGWLATQLPVGNAQRVLRVAGLPGEGELLVSGGAIPQGIKALSRAVIDATGEGTETTPGAGRLSATVVSAAGAQWLVERLQPTETLVVVGINAGAIALLRMAEAMGWGLLAMRPQINAERPAGLPSGCAFFSGTPEQLASELARQSRARVVLMTHSLHDDVRCLKVFSRLRLDYLGAIGSRKRAGRLYAESGLTAAQLHAPAGLDLGDETPEAIAIAILAEIIARTHGRDGRPLSLTRTGIHA